MRCLRPLFVATLAATTTLSAFPWTADANAAPSSASSKLLIRSDLPYGWMVHKSKVNLGVGCLKPLAKPRALDYTAKVSRTFVDDGNPPELTEILVTSKTPAALYTGVITSLNKCHVVKGYFGGHHLVGTVRHLALARHGLASRAYVAHAKVEGALLGEDVVVIETTRAVVVVAEGNIGSVDGSQYQGFIADALRKLATPARTKKS